MKLQFLKILKQCFLEIQTFNIEKKHGEVYNKKNKAEKKTLKTLWPLFIDGVQLPQGYSHFEEAVYFLPFSFQKFLMKTN